MASARERLSIFENIIARVGLDGNVLEEYSKAMSTLNGLQTMTEMAPPPMGNTILTGGNTGVANQQLPPNGTMIPPIGNNGSMMP